LDETVDETLRDDLLASDRGMEPVAMSALDECAGGTTPTPGSPVGTTKDRSASVSPKTLDESILSGNDDSFSVQGMEAVNFDALSAPPTPAGLPSVDGGTVLVFRQEFYTQGVLLGSMILLGLKPCHMVDPIAYLSVVDFFFIIFAVIASKH
jgi:hypothetical protein